ncbi:hypothetical protein F4824DRAFT_277502 [Ustulina deusta]|nr:hypothetical protein F4823DRAFT_232337 [Ustulina deusta]KAI3333055.1 hypothetical protein F4824DRAFT_277502 [Ustulina deusta]
MSITLTLSPHSQLPLLLSLLPYLRVTALWPLVASFALRLHVSRISLISEWLRTYGSLAAVHSTSFSSTATTSNSNSRSHREKAMPMNF